MPTPMPSQHLGCRLRAPRRGWQRCRGSHGHLPRALIFIPSAGLILCVLWDQEPQGSSSLSRTRSLAVGTPGAPWWPHAPRAGLAPRGGCPVARARAGRAELEQGPGALQQSSVLLLIPWAAGTGSCCTAGAAAAGPLCSPRELRHHPDPAAFRCEEDNSRDTKHARKGCSAGELLARFAIHGTNLSEIHFRRKNIFNSTVCNHLIKVIRSESPRNNVQRCVTAELAAALSGQPRPGWDT